MHLSFLSSRPKVGALRTQRTAMGLFTVLGPGRPPPYKNTERLGRSSPGQEHVGRGAALVLRGTPVPLQLRERS